MMIKKVLFACTVVALAACSKNSDGFQAPPSEYTSTTSFGAAIDPNHTWNMVQQATLKITALPSDFETKVVMILDANPFIDESASILAYTEDIHSTISYEAPSYLTKLYAACVDKRKSRPAPFCFCVYAVARDAGRILDY